ncbi:MAG: tRNA uridine-5-carboxymethylaminomethyl(34) synthesis GTPase MnmE [Gemmiger sp.]|uniref:tRNA uridine-5-carboxymethylaminomethyl(34) synthesis GTPase MnmE n=1 Tax=Gemmiger sp. TaxID=2049027 RepID=UPI002E796120|nr:tRNA uridine-5-carboxymethylaminomethyl(34) synthesis GTPase MnmE [Gemmiger sp.]MEE0800557.1 tRNA uridine-5-carboxymethylaminomethyl(34) synthesis GTPase MnmE [Gemmiger sp.]
MPSTICALATPPGVGGIAVVRLSGPQAYPIAERVFRPVRAGRQVRKAAGYTAMLGHYLLRGAEMDETVALFYRAPHSYTGEDVIEFSVHGGHAMVQGLLEALYLAGASPAGPGEFTRRALENGRISLTQAEAVMEIISADGRQGAALAKSALDGALARRIDGIRAALQTLAAHITAWIDYPEEDVPELSDAELAGTLTAQKQALDALIDGYGAGAVLRHGVDCVLLGRPNVGKSTLLNLLAGFDRAIVTPIAGTTRDVLEQPVMLGDTGIRLNLFDTAGVRDAGDDPVEAEGIRRSWKKLEEAGLVLAVFDLGEPLTAEDLDIARRCSGRPALAILNKQDLAGQGDAQRLAEQALAPYFRQVLAISARDPASLDPLCRAVSELLGTARLDPNAAALCSARQLDAAREARDALAEALQARAGGFGLDAIGVCLADAQRALARLTGEDAGEATLDEVFSTFCVGK